MKRILITIAAIAAAASILTVSVSANGRFGWYCVRKKDHARPVCESQMAFISDHDAVFIGSDPDEKVLYLTFDAGYENGNVEKILDTMKEQNVTGAFFVLSNFIERNTDLVRRMIGEGHLVCNHTCRHKDMSAFSDEEFEAELRALEKVAKENGIALAPFYRPPEGRFSENNLITAEKMGYTTVFWSFAYADWDNKRQPSPERAKKLILDNTHNGAVILLHPTSKTNAEILSNLIREWRSEGYRFGSLDELVK